VFIFLKNSFLIDQGINSKAFQGGGGCAAVHFLLRNKHNSILLSFLI